MNTKLLGGILLITGTSIGGGMLALPLATAQLGFTNALLFLVLCWAIMTASAFVLLEVSLWHPMNSNLITMAKKTLGRFGQVIAWVSYLLLLYALLAAYISGGSDFIQQYTFNVFRINLNAKTSIVLFFFPLSLIVYQGMRLVDYLNRGLMFSKFAATGLLILCILPFVSIDPLFTTRRLLDMSDLSLSEVMASTAIIITSFGFSVILPSLCSYFKQDTLQLRKAVLIGSLIPLVCYILWELVIMGVIPSTGSSSLAVMVASGHSSSDLIKALSQSLHNPFISFLAKTFTAICFITSFLGVSLSLFDFLSDGLRAKKTYSHKLLMYLLTFLPPLIIADRYPNIFIKALSYAGVLCAILLIAFPAMMAWSGRYMRVKPDASSYRVVGGKCLLITLLLTSCLLIVLSLI